jgi:hypothetical protein
MLRGKILKYIGLTKFSTDLHCAEMLQLANISGLWCRGPGVPGQAAFP